MSKSTVIPFPARPTAKAKPPGPHGPTPQGTGGQVIDLTDHQVRELSLDLLQLALDLAGIADPTPVSDGASALISIARGQWLDAIISGVSLFPYVGDLAKTGKLPKYLRSVEKAIDLAGRSEKVAAALTPAFRKLKQGLDLLPRGANAILDRMKDRVDTFLRGRGAAKVVAALPDVSKQFKFSTHSLGGKAVKTAEGWLGVPGHVKTHRSPYQQKKLSAGTGDDAGHLIGNQFGPPGDARNLSAQNWIANRGQGTFHHLEDHWAAKLKDGYKVHVKVTDVSNPGTARPYHRKVEWVEVAPNGKATTTHSLDFVNTHSEKSRAAQGMTSNFPPGHQADVIPIDRGRKP